MVIGALNVLWLYTEFFVGLHDPQNIDLFSKITLLSMLIPVIGIIVSYKKLKSLHFLTNAYGQRLLPGIYISCIMAIVSALGQLLYHVVLNPSYFDSLIQYSNAQGLSNAETHFTTGSYVLQVFLFNLFIGILVSLIVSLLTRKNVNKP
jgi:hypothetical protein